MSDIFREVDEDIRQEKYRRLWDRFGPWVLAAAVLIVVGTGGYRGWLYYQEQQSQTAGDTFLEAVRLASESNFSGAEEQLQKLADTTGGYPVLARMRTATGQALAGDKEAALATFDAIARDAGLDGLMRGAASLRAGYLALDLEDYVGVADRVEGLTAEDNAFRFSAREILAVSAWKEGDNANALKWVDAIREDASAPSSVSRRVAVLAELIQAQDGTQGNEGSTE